MRIFRRMSRRPEELALFMMDSLIYIRMWIEIGGYNMAKDCHRKLLELRNGVYLWESYE